MELCTNDGKKYCAGGRSCVGDRYWSGTGHVDSGGAWRVRQRTAVDGVAAADDYRRGIRTT